MKPSESSRVMSDDLPPRDSEIIACGFPDLPFSFIKTVYFDYDKSILKPNGMASVHRNAEFLKLHPKARILIEGNCDERGTNEYNLALGERRAQAIKNYMINSGIDASRITTKSWGEERPIGLGHNESSWWQNRRGDMFFVEE
jgi:peptidoglycan-associated lipoprotein